MEWYDLETGDILEINPEFQSDTGCTSCLGFASGVFYVIETVALSDSLLAGQSNEYVDLILKCMEQETIHDIRIGLDGKVIKACIRGDKPPIFKLVALAEEQDGNQMDRLEAG
jgi:hypothetical protein